MLNPAPITLKNSRTAMVLYLGIMFFGVLTYLTIGNREYPPRVRRLILKSGRVRSFHLVLVRGSALGVRFHLAESPHE